MAADPILSPEAERDVDQAYDGMKARESVGERILWYASRRVFIPLSDLPKCTLKYANHFAGT